MNNRLRAQNTILAILAAFLSVILANCGGSGTSVTTSSATLVSLSITPSNPSIAPGTTMQLTAIGMFSNNTQRNITTLVTWATSDTTVASISNTAGSQGLATTTAVVSSATATITAMSGSITGTTVLTKSPVSAITVAPLTVSIAPGTTLQFSATGTLANGASQVLTSFATWTSLNTASGTVSDIAGSKGLATAGSTSGPATIQAALGGVLGSATLTSSHVATITVAPLTVSVPQGFTQQFTATGALMDSTIQNLTTFAT
jgi:hypothetical protein